MKKVEIERLIDELTIPCTFCSDYYPVDDMQPMPDEVWLCKPCYRNALEGVL